MRFVYAVVLSGSRFLMVRNPDRGWEMPGGIVRENETPAEAVVREVREETGYRFEPLASVRMEEGTVFAGREGGREGPGEFEWEFLDTLPRNLSFDRGEYEAIIRWAREAIGAPKDRSSGRPRVK